LNKICYKELIEIKMQVKCWANWSYRLKPREHSGSLSIATAHNVNTMWF